MAQACLIFTEGGSAYGFGHLMRCMALYDELVSQGIGTKLVVKGDCSVRKVVGDRALVLDDWYLNWNVYFGNLEKVSVYSIIDSYHAGFSVYEGIEESSRQTIYIDDTNRMEYPPGIIVNPCLKGAAGYRIKTGQKLLSGSDYVILRQAFTKSVGQRLANYEVKKVLVSLGGSDIRNLTPLITKSLMETFASDVKIEIVVSSGFQNKKEIEACTNTVQEQVSLHYDLSDQDMQELMIDCDLAITAAGQTVNELITTQAPFICVKIIDNQEENIQALLEKDLIVSYFDYDEYSNETEFQMWLKEQIMYFRNRGNRQEIMARMAKERISEGTMRIVQALLEV